MAWRDPKRRDAWLQPRCFQLRAIVRDVGLDDPDGFQFAPYPEDGSVLLLRLEQKAMSDAERLRRGDQTPHFRVWTVRGAEFSYSTIWQRRNLLLVVLSAVQADGDYVSAVGGRATDFEALDTECVITTEPVLGVRAPGALIADRWGEIIYITAVRESAALPTPDDLLGWLEYVQRRCPECEGEVK